MIMVGDYDDHYDDGDDDHIDDDVASVNDDIFYIYWKYDRYLFANGSWSQKNASRARLLNIQ